MSVWPEKLTAALAGRDGDLVSVSIDVDPQELERLLESLAQIEFPINPQIYHEAALVYVYPDQHEEAVSTTLVEFPAYAQQLGAVRKALAARGFDPEKAVATGMWESIHQGRVTEIAPAGSPYRARYRLKQRLASVS